MTLQVAVWPPSAVVTVIVALPADFPTTYPSAVTVATASLSLFHVTLLFVAFEGVIVASRVSV